MTSIIRALAIVPLFVLFFSGTKFPGKKVVKQPNILLICADDLGFSDIGCYGSEVKTPNLDRLAATGLKFRQFYNTAKCHPSRASLLTGLYAQQNGYFKKFDQPIINGITLGEYLQDAGYLTLWSGKHHGSENPITRGFDHYFGLKDGACNYFNPGLQREGEGKPAQKKVRKWCIDDKEYEPYTPAEKDFYTTDYFTRHALQWLDQYKNTSKPFFLYLAYNAPHDPLMAWPEDIAKYRDTYKAGYESVRNARYKKQLQLGLINSSYQLSKASHKTWNSLNQEQKNEEAQKMAVYAAMIDRMDQNIGYILKKLKEQGKYDDTLIIFLSDNGASAEVVNIKDSYGPIGSMTNWTSLGEDWANVCNTPFRFFKNYSYEGGIASPLIISWKNGLVDTNRTSDHVGHLIDIMATFVDLSKSPYPSTYKGKPILPYEGTSLLPAIRNEKMVNRKPIFWEWQNGQALRDNKWKLVKDGLDKPWALFDMTADPSETRNLANEHLALVEKMGGSFKEWKARMAFENKQYK